MFELHVVWGHVRWSSTKQPALPRVDLTWVTLCFERKMFHFADRICALTCVSVSVQQVTRPWIKIPPSQVCWPMLAQISPMKFATRLASNGVSALFDSRLLWCAWVQSAHLLSCWAVVHCWKLILCSFLFKDPRFKKNHEPEFVTLWAMPRPSQESLLVNLMQMKAPKVRAQKMKLFFRSSCCLV